MNTLIRISGILLSLFGVVALTGKEWIVSCTLIPAGLILIALCNQLNNQDKIIGILGRLSAPNQFFADKYFTLIIKKYTDGNPQLANLTFSATFPERLSKGSFSVMLKNDRKIYNAILQCEGVPENVNS